jgi:dehydrogenase/reductase SDR family member 1
MGLIDGRVVSSDGGKPWHRARNRPRAGCPRGATVVVTARTMTADQAPRLSPGLPAIPGTLAETVELVQSTGAQALALPADLANDEHVRVLIAEVIRRYGRIDVLVNSAMGLTSLGGVFWEMPLESWDTMHTVGPRCAFVTACFAAPHMIHQRHGLIVNVSSSGAKRNTHHGVPYGVAKAATDRLSQGLAHDLQPHNVAAVSLWPRAARTERLELAARGSAAAAGFPLPPGD